MTKVILFKGKFKINPPFNETQLRGIKANHPFDEFALSNNCLECKCELQELTEEDAFWDVNYIMETYENKNKLRGETIGLKFDHNKYKFCRWFIKNNNIDDEFIDCNITKKGKPRGQYNQRQTAQPRRTAQSSRRLQTSSPEIISINPPRRRQLQTSSPEVVSINPPRQSSPPRHRQLQTSSPEVVSMAPSTNNLTKYNRVIFSNASNPTSPPKGQPTLQQFIDKHKTSSPPIEKDIDTPSLDKSDFDTLDDGNEVADAIIYAYININNKKRKDKRKIVVEQNFFMECIENNLFDMILTTFNNYKNKGVAYYDYIIFPINYQFTDANGQVCGHWILCIIEIKEKTIKIYDSEGHTDYDQQVKQIKRFLSHAKIKEKFKVKYISKPRQPSGNDCGVFVSEYAKRWLLNKPIDFTYKDIPQIRERMRNELRPYLKT